MHARSGWLCGFLSLLALFSPAQSAPRVVHVFVALCDNANQGIVPVPAHLGRGDHPASNLYWGAAYGVRTFFRRHSDWEEVSVTGGPKPEILQRVVFRHRTQNVYLVADAYNGSAIRTTIEDFLTAAAGKKPERISVTGAVRSIDLEAGGSAALAVFVGHNGLMDFSLPVSQQPRSTEPSRKRETVILACASKGYFQPAIRATGAEPLIWTTGLMAPEAYTLAAILAGWIQGEPQQSIRTRAAESYCRYQKCSQKAGLRLFAAGW